MAYKKKPEAAKTPSEKADADFMELARKRFKRCVDHEEDQRKLEVDDRKFHAGDSDNGWQWDGVLRSARINDPNGARPCLTINKLPQHTAQVINEQRQNRPSLKAIPVDDKADPKTAEILTGVFRHIQINSDADVAYDTAGEQQTISGRGYWRVLTQYATDVAESDEQDIFIRRIRNSFSVYLDPNIQDPTGADARFGFITEELDEDEFDERYPDAKPIDWNSDAKEFSGWYRQEVKKVRIAEYWYVEKLKGGKGRPTVHWCLLSGKEKLETRAWAGKYIPIVRIVGNELEIEGDDVTIKGMVRNAKDAQRMYNYNASMEVESNALAPKAPFVAPDEGIEGYEEQWKNANRVNYSVLKYRPFDEQGRPLTPPRREPPAFVARAFIEAKLSAADDLKSTMGQYDASLGAKSNETSGKAINARDRQADTATFHYMDNIRRGIQQTGRIVLDLLPFIYDTKRVARIIGEDGTPAMAMVDPTMQGAYRKAEQGQPYKALFNPTVGRYDVVVTVGPSYQTKRQEAAEAMTQTAQAWPKLMDVAGDLVVKSQDWPGAEEIGRRIRATIPPEIRGPDEDEGEPIPPQAMQMMNQMKQMIGELQGRLQASQEQIQELDQQVKDRSQEFELKSKEIDSKERIAQAADETKLMIAQIQAEQKAIGEKLQLLESLFTQPPPNGSSEPTGDESREVAPRPAGDLAPILEMQESLRARAEELRAMLARPRTLMRGPDGEVGGLQ